MMTDQIPYLEPSSELETLIALRREFHANPETMWTEFWTTAKICDILEPLGFDIKVGRELYDGMDDKEMRFELPSHERLAEAFSDARSKGADIRWLEKMEGGYTGLVARIQAPKPGPRFGFRFDIDALPVRESSEPDHLPSKEGFSSLNGRMHACAHDGHMTIGIGLAKRISENLQELAGEFYIIFQPGEEGGCGGNILAQIDELQNLDHFTALHLGKRERSYVACPSWQ